MFLGLHRIKYSIVEALPGGRFDAPGNHGYCSAALWVLFTLRGPSVRVSMTTELIGVANSCQLMERNGGGRTLGLPTNGAGVTKCSTDAVVNLMGSVL